MRPDLAYRLNREATVRNLLKSLACAAVVASPAATAGVTGNVGAVSEYMFRGVAQTGGAAVQGGIDYASDIGLYAGTWGSNVGFAGGTEVDLYGGYTKSFGAVGLDVGAIYYWYSEEDEAIVKAHTLEVYAGGSLGPVTLKYYYADEAHFFGASDPVTGEVEETHYLTALLALPLSETLSLTGNLGYYFGDGIENFLTALGATSPEDKYIDYSIGLAKTLDNGLSASFQYIATDIDATGVDDEPKFVIGLKKSFDL